MKTVIQIENLSKRYYIGGVDPQIMYRYSALRDVIVDNAMAPFRRIGQLLRGELKSAANLDEEIWALRDVSFSVSQGEVVGIIGRNGAGKSTLLKILSRITRPTKGQVTLDGRLGSLLEVGTGFHPELTGRENIYLNGAILGMTRSEIDSKFGEIVDFSGVEKFLDTPVKRYSSGMVVRLAFSVAAHLEPEILVIDEVLSVGDAAFQKKSMGKMGDVAGSGRTVLFVSHNMAAIENLCTRGIVLEQGEVVFDGNQTEAIQHYLKGLDDLSDIPLSDRTDARTNGSFVFTAVKFTDKQNNRLNTVPSGTDLEVHLEYRSEIKTLTTRNIVLGVTVYNALGVPLFTLSTRVASLPPQSLPPKGVFVCTIEKLPLPAGNYTLRLVAKYNENYAYVLENAASLSVVEGDFFGTGKYLSASLGVSLIKGSWQIKES